MNIATVEIDCLNLEKTKQAIENAYQQGRADAIDAIWKLAAEISFDDGIYQSITLGELDEIGLKIKEQNNDD